MKDWLDKLTDVTAIGTSETRLKGALGSLTENLGFDGYAFLPIAVSNYAPEGQGIYFDRKYHTVDPIVLRGKSLNGAFVWSSEEEKSHLDKEQRDFFRHASDFGIRSGVTIPVRTPNGFVSRSAVRPANIIPRS
ncbi:autoinducer binding domain-containing protein [Mesorhizobium sp. SB112]|uniref:autoinducer binding domain-containing protein n=1 Tax=Mesorhizobium sp. SB112 TaxID=3151853 RepID=UPI0032667CB3